MPTQALGILLAAILAVIPSLSVAQVRSGPPGSPPAERSRVVVLGFVEQEGARLGILGWEGLVFLVREGDTILGTYRVEKLGEDFAIL